MRHSDLNDELLCASESTKVLPFVDIDMGLDGPSEDPTVTPERVLGMRFCLEVVQNRATIEIQYSRMVVKSTKQVRLF